MTKNDAMAAPPSLVNGWLIIDKDLHDSSAKAVAITKRLLKAAKVGHAGTLDPLATGILPIALGEATKTVTFATDASKAYTFTITWGEARSTEDSEGEVVATSTIRPTRQQIIAVLPEFIGEISQTPPAFSALKVDGKRAYAMARAGETVTLKPRIVQIDTLVLLENDDNTATFSMDCGKGTYVRALARDLAERLGTCGYISRLRRTRVGKFSENNAISLDKLKELVHNDAHGKVLLPVEVVLDDIPALPLTNDQAQHLRFGRTLRLDTEHPQEIEAVRAMNNGKLVALGSIENHILRPLRVFNH